VLHGAAQARGKMWPSTLGHGSRAYSFFLQYIHDPSMYKNHFDFLAEFVNLETYIPSVRHLVRQKFGRNNVPSLLNIVELQAHKDLKQHLQ
jgi:hypothetical protein